MIGRHLCLLACFFAAAFAAYAQPADVPGDEIKPIQLIYAEKGNAPGRWAEAEFTAGEQPVRYYVRGTDISAPLSIQVIAANTKRPLQVSLHRQAWGRAEKTGATGSTGNYAFEGRAFGDVGVQLVSSSGEEASGTVIFWQGAPAAPTMARVYTPPQGNAAGAAATGMAGGAKVSGAAAGGAGGGVSPIFYVIALLLTVIVVLLAVILLRRSGGRSAAAVILMGGLAAWTLHPAPASAQIVPIPGDPPPSDGGKDVFDGDTTTGQAGKDEMAPKPGEDIFTGDDRTVPATKDEMAPKPGEDIFGDETRTGQAGKDEMAPKPDEDGWEPSGEPKPGEDDGWEPSGEPKPDESGTTDSDYQERLEEAYERIEELDRQASSNRAEIERLAMMIESDSKMEPDPSNLPPLPLSCRPPAVDAAAKSDAAIEAGWENYDECRSCYDQPLKDLDDLMVFYEKLRIIYGSTRDFVDKAIAIGDAVEKPHYLVEAAWAHEKSEILKTFDGTKEAYDAKRDEFNGRLTGILDEIGACETRYNNNPMWRETDGRMFYQTIKASYQRTD